MPAQDPSSGEQQQSVLFLQGNASRFFTKLARDLLRRGHTVHKIDFNGGDALFWQGPKATAFRGRLSTLPAFLNNYIDRYKPTDVVLFGDARPIHQAVLGILCDWGIRIWVVEEGYIRPTWITFERGGTNGYSVLPKRPEDYMRLAADLPHRTDINLPPASFFRRASEDIAYHVARVALRPLFPTYRFHAPVDPFVSYVSFLRRFLLNALEKPKAKRLEQALGQMKYFLLPLQLDTDYQVRLHSRFGEIRPALEEIIQSFAAYAPADTHLVVKSHPLDNGMTDWRKVVEKIASKAGIAARVHFIVHPNLALLLNQSQGVVTINSTVGTLALNRGLPVVTLGCAVYDIEGLTFKFGLDRFWTEGERPDPVLFDAFRRVLTNTCLIQGAFFDDTGLDMAVGEAVSRLEAAARDDVAEAREFEYLSAAQ